MNRDDARWLRIDTAPAQKEGNRKIIFHSRKNSLLKTAPNQRTFKVIGPQRMGEALSTILRKSALADRVSLAGPVMRMNTLP